MDCPQTTITAAPLVCEQTRYQELVASLRRELGAYTCLEEDSQEPWEGEWSPGELEARLACYAAA